MLSPRLFLGLVLGAMISTTACVAVDGGAIEFSWAVRDYEGSESSCVAATISDVTVCWRDSSLVGELVCTEDDSVSFDCEREQGATGFEVPPGERTLWIEVSCSNGQPADPAGYQVPAPIVRTVTDGDIVTLNSLLIIASRGQNQCGERPCTCPP